MEINLNIFGASIVTLYFAIAIWNFLHFKSGNTDRSNNLRYFTLFTAIVNIIYIALLSNEHHHILFGNSFEILSMVNLLTVIIYIVIQYSSNLPGTGLFLFPVVAFMQLAIFINLNFLHTEQEILLNPYHITHTIFIVIGNSAFQIAMFYGAMFIIIYNQLKFKKIGKLFNYLPDLTTLERLSRRAAAIGFVFFTLGLITGSAWSGYVWNDTQTPFLKLILYFLVWIIYGISFQIKFFKGWQGKRSSYLFVLGGIISLTSLLI